MRALLVLALTATVADAAPGRPDRSPPVISLTLPELAQNVSHRLPNAPVLDAEAARNSSQRNLAGHRSVTCEVGTTAADAAACPEPTCRAHDHHDGELPCANTYILINRDNTALDPADSANEAAGVARTAVASNEER